MGIANYVRPNVPPDVVKKLGAAGLTNLLQLMADSYRDLKEMGFVQADSRENTITEEWLVQISARCQQKPTSSYVPIQQKEDSTKAKSRGNPPTVDFCFRHRFDNRVYFGAECKLLDEGSKKYLEAYLSEKEGIGRFLDGRYSSHSGAGAMVGYVRSGSCAKVAESLEIAIQKLAGTPKLNKSQVLSNFDQLYESLHTRECPINEFRCFHLLFGFDCITV